MEININKNDVIHFIGIGGIGMSGITITEKFRLYSWEVTYLKVKILKIKKN